MRAAALAPLAVAVVLTAAPARAQALFVQAGYGADVRRFSAERGEEVLDGGAGTVSIAVAGFAAPRWTAGVEVESGAESIASRTVTVTLAGSPTRLTTTYALARRTISALAGYHAAPGRRVRLGLYAGLSFNSVRREISSDAPPIVLSEPADPSVFLDRFAAPLVGADLAVALAPRLALVGTARAGGLTLAGDAHGVSVRAGGALRVLF